MRRAIWMALAFMGTAPLVALAQQNTGAAPAASPSGAASIDRGQDTTATQAPGSPGQQSAGSIGTAQGQPATGGSAGTQGTTGQTDGTGGGGGAGGAAGMGGGGGPTYRGTTEEAPPSASPPVDVGTRVGPEPGEQAGGAGTGSVGTGTGGGGTGGGDTGGTGSVSGGGTGTGGTGVSGGGTGTGRGGGVGGQEAMQRELTTLRQRVSRLEAEVGALRGTGGGGTGGGGTGGATPGVDTGTPGPDPEDMEVKGPVTVATAVFDGRVVDITRKHIDIVDTSDGTFYRLTVDDQTRAFVGPDLKRIPVDQLSEGTQVRTSFALISGVEHARNIVTQPQRAQQQRQGQQQGLRQQRQERMGPGQRMAVPPQQTPKP
ncbi:hypothetical protein ATI61_12114 [Archangium gephyra]|uniref:PE-PGRS family protein n=1 Tax=Archangium gephyra TaxID=48 RepID=A0AAC8TA52_9BACT|nr:hypothetical protein [Archangium gephyra]AKI98451.1 PE-PGRS family protein [Archangium gephyra]REG20449.1 hypothetical protein ATI61_12114 [Archangium gephyra]